MCSACMTIWPSGSNSAVEASRRSLMFAECAERTSTAPISSHAARRPPSITWRVMGSSTLHHHRLGARVRAPARRHHQRGARQLEDRRALRLRLALAEHLGLVLLIAEPHRSRPLWFCLRGLAGLGLGARQGGGHPDGHQLERGVRILVAVALLVGAVEAAAQIAGLGLERASHRQLEGLARVAEVVAGAELRLGLAQLLAPALAQP